MDLSYRENLSERESTLTVACSSKDNIPQDKQVKVKDNNEVFHCANCNQLLRNKNYSRHPESTNEIGDPNCRTNHFYSYGVDQTFPLWMGGWGGHHSIPYQFNTDPEYFQELTVESENNCLVPQKISTILEKIYRFNTVESQDQEERDLRVCSQCAVALTQLYNLHQQVDRLRSSDSFVSKKLFSLEAAVRERSPFEDNPSRCEVILKEVDDNPCVIVPEKNFLPPSCTSSIPNNSNDPSNDSEDDPKLGQLIQPIVILERVKVPERNARRRATITFPEVEVLISDDEFGVVEFDNDDDGDSSYKEEEEEVSLMERAKMNKPRKRSKRGKSVRHTRSSEKIKRKRKNGLVKKYLRRKLRVPNPCWYCTKDFPTPAECLEHTKAEHFVSGDLLCEQCSRICTNKRSFKQHQRKCSEITPGERLVACKCPHCSKEFAIKHDLVVHLETHNEEGKYSCDKCDFRAKSQLLINLHSSRMHVVGEREAWKCDFETCTATFKTKHCMRIHFVHMHTEKGKQRYRERLDKVLQRQREKNRQRLAAKSYICPECNVDFFSNMRLVYHKKSAHQTEKKFVCHQCGKDFANKNSLQFHLSVAHTDERPFICEHCGKAYKSVANLRAHVLHTHDEEGRLKYNEKMRIHNQRRRLVAQALSRSTVTTPMAVPNNPSNLTYYFSPDFLTQ